MADLERANEGASTRDVNQAHGLRSAANFARRGTHSRCRSTTPFAQDHLRPIASRPSKEEDEAWGNSPIEVSKAAGSSMKQ